MALEGAEAALQSWVRGRHRQDAERSQELLGRAEPALRRVISAELRGYGLAPQDREEAINRILLRIWRWQPTREEFTARAFRAAVSTMTRRDVLAWIRRRRTRDGQWTAFLDEAGIDPAGGPDAAASPPIPLETASEGERATRALGHLEDLDETDRRIIALRYGRGLSYAALAEATGIPAASIGRRLADVLKRLRRHCGRDVV